MAASDHARDDDELVQRIEVVANPSFGAALKFMLLGASIGGTIAYLLAERKNDARLAELQAAREAEKLESRVSKLARRAQRLAKGTRAAASYAATTIAPAVSAAIVSGREAARDLEADLRRDPNRDDIEHV